MSGQGILALTGVAIAYDFNHSLQILPNLLYPCTSASDVWAPASQVVWDILTSTAAVLGTLISVTTTVLKLGEKHPSTVHTNSEPGSTKLSRTEDLEVRKTLWNRIAHSAHPEPIFTRLAFNNALQIITKHFHCSLLKVRHKSMRMCYTSRL